MRCYWTTTNEVNTRDFLVQRSTDSTSFAVAGSVGGGDEQWVA